METLLNNISLGTALAWIIKLWFLWIGVCVAAGLLGLVLDKIKEWQEKNNDNIEDENV
jgi:hypothetical protein